MKLIITIDTEEDNWGEFNAPSWPVDNVGEIPALQQLFDDFKVKPTYLVNYTIVSNEKAVSILKPILMDGRCEIGGHPHPWNTPPFEEKINEENSMLCNLPSDLQFRKIQTLNESIESAFGVTPISFRAGRYGFSTEVATNIHKLGYKVDTSITPFTNWEEEYGPDFSDILPHPFLLNQLLEIPVSVGFTQSNFKQANIFFNSLKKSQFNKYTRLLGILSKIGVLNKVSLSPEFSTTRDMIKLTNTLKKKGFPYVNMEFHSTSLMHGAGQYIKTLSDKQQFIQRIKDFLIFARDTGMESITLSETLNLLPEDSLRKRNVLVERRRRSRRRKRNTLNA